MITIPELSRMLSIENEIIHDQTGGLTQADTLVQPRPSGNCMNWVLGHLLESQISLLAALGGESPFDPARLTRYERESQPILGEEPGVLPLDQLLAGHDAVFAAIDARLGELSEADFEEEIQIRDRPVKRGWRVFFLHFHYTYHIGQLEFLRQLAGKTDKII